MRQPYVVPRRRLLFAVWLTVVALPILVIDNIPRTEARAASVQAVTADAVDGAHSAAAAATPVTSAIATTEATSTTPPSSATTEPATTAPRAASARAKAPAPTTTSPPAVHPSTTAVPPNEQTGGASWYDYNPGECAHLTIPKGTVVTVTRLSTGVSVTCVVTDRGPTGAGRVIDLDRDTFSRLADPGAGVIQDRITW